MDHPCADRHYPRSASEFQARTRFITPTRVPGTSPSPSPGKTIVIKPRFAYDLRKSGAGLRSVRWAFRGQSVIIPGFAPSTRRLLWLTFH